MRLTGKISCLCGGPLQLGEWNSDERQLLSICTCRECGATLALQIRLHAVPQEIGRGRIPSDDPRHGLNGYRNHGCRCEICRRAGVAAMQAWRQRRKEVNA
jgi:hypothetical protein